jgi:hypothetical protein
MARRNERGGG